MILRSQSVSHRLFILSMLVVSIGCAETQDGPSRYLVKGTVQFQGKPVPVGSISFEPDSKQGNPGPGTTASIRDGKFETPADRGTIGGPHILSITGYDGIPYEVPGEGTDPNGKSLFTNYTTTFDLPRESTNIELVVTPKENK